MKLIDFDNTVPNFEDGEFKWYIDNYFLKYLITEQAENLPRLDNLMCFVVVSSTVKDYVLINNNQEVLAAYPYPEGFEQMEANINIRKISKCFEENEHNI